MPKKKKPSTKKMLKKKRGYQRVRAKHVAKIREDLQTGRLLESIPKMKREINGYDVKIGGYSERVDRRKKRGTKRKK
ncbi:MAG: hypothetical protein V3T58_04625 [Candidatus Hydrothermarchaeales archaeon]